MIELGVWDLIWEKPIDQTFDHGMIRAMSTAILKTIELSVDGGATLRVG